ncbi:MAG: hypothetical protein TU35_008345 [Thermoproteus sp. AZ2]|jgi:hypothetical protein|uniref:Uncharacterized protein n=1 Tax=Thermoproteus sp. AZ2 TaxID=1609232 RepID=A0ACC6V3B9_9CREN|nr:MAG: hypothetical protein TU35_03400 [Thermoproteus sp. AZ2]
MYYLADERLRAAVEKYGIEKAMACRTLYQLVRLYKAGLVTEAVGKRAEALISDICPKDLIDVIAQTTD